MADINPAKAALPVLGLHHSAYRCRDSEETRAFYEDKIGFPLVMSLELDAQVTTGIDVRYMHTFYDIGSHKFEEPNYLAFFEVPDREEDDPDELFKRRWGMDLHFAIRVPDHATLYELRDRLVTNHIEVEGPVSHGMITSIYFHDPNGYRLEFAAEDEEEKASMAEHKRKAHDNLRDWEAWKVERYQSKSA